MSLTQIHLSWTDPLTGESFDREVPLPATLGRGTDNTLVLTSERVSRKHASLMVDDTAIVLVDSSTNGTFVNGERAPRSAVRPGDVIEVGPFAFTVLDDPAPQSVTLVWAQGGMPQRQTFPLPLTIGRSAANGLVITDGAISRMHAILEATANGVSVTDQSSNGTFVNGERTAHATVRPGDILRIGDVTITIEDLGSAVRPAPPGVLVPPTPRRWKRRPASPRPPARTTGRGVGGFDPPPPPQTIGATRLSGAGTTYAPPGGADKPSGPRRPHRDPQEGLRCHNRHRAPSHPRSLTSLSCRSRPSHKQGCRFTPAPMRLSAVAWEALSSRIIS